MSTESPRRRALLAALALLAIAVLLALVAWPGRPDGDPAAPRRLGANRRQIPPPPVFAATADPARPGADPDAAADDDADAGDGLPRTFVVIQLARPSRAARYLILPKRATLDPARFWPLPASGLVPESDAAEALEQLLALDVPLGDAAERDWVALAQASLADPDDPASQGPAAWLLALEASRREDAIARQDAFVGVLAEMSDGVATPDWLLGRPQTSDEAAFADGLYDATDDPTLRGIARLYALDAAVRAGDDPDAARALALELVRDADDPAVRAEAAGLLTRLPDGGPLSEADLDALDAALDDVADPAAELDVAALGLDAALRADDADPDQAQRWIDRLDAAIAARCAVDEDPDGDGDDAGWPDGQGPDEQCATHQANRDDAVASLGVADPQDAADWRQAMEIAGRRCAAEHGAPAELRDEARFTTGWAFDPWTEGAGASGRPGPEVATPFTACFEAGTRRGPPPDAPLAVNVVVIGDGG